MVNALSDLRRTRRRRRLGDTEWFDLAYRVYLAGFFGGAAIIILSDQVGDVELSDARVADVLGRGPAWLGLVAAAALAIGLRSGAVGGPVTVESADVHHLLLAPVDRAAVLRRPLWQRLRVTAFGGALAGGIAGLLAEQRIPSSAGAWVWWGAVFGGAVGAVTVAAAAIAHAARLRPWIATLLGGAALGVQGWAALGERRGPADALGRVALRDVTRGSGDLLSLVAVAALVAIATGVVGRPRVEQLARRGALVSQLRFAVTMQDLRTVVLLRRQLRQERARTRPWVPLPRARTAAHPASAALRRSVHGMLRTPAARLGRMASLVALAGVAAGAGARGTTPAFVVSGLLLFVLGLDLIEPLSQEIDHPDRTAGLPRGNGWIHAHLVVGPVLAAVPLSMIGAVACTLVAPGSGPAAFVLALPIVWCGMVGAVVNAVRDEFDPSGTRSKSYELVMPPEVSGFSDVTRMVWPVALSNTGMVAAFLVREAPDAGSVLRALVGLVLWLTAARWWLVHRSAIRRRWRDFAAGAA
jgi:Family of unknown function (DUF6297)